MGTRLSPLDAAFLHVEDARNPMQLAGILSFDGPAPSFEEFKSAIEASLPALPHLRRRLSGPGLLRRPEWVPVDDLDLAYHLSDIPLPGSATDDDVRHLINTRSTEALDRTKPLWRMGLVRDLPGGGFGLLLTIHHCMVDGLSIMEIFSTLCTVAADQPPVPAPVGKPATSTELAARRPKLPHEHLLSATRLIRGAPPTILNTGRPSAQREVHSVTLPLEDVHALRSGLGVTVNTVVLSVVAGALRRFFDATGSDLQDVVAFVPVNRRVDTERGFHGNQIAMTYPRLPVGETDPLSRVDRVLATTAACSEERQADTTAGLIALTGLAPDVVAAVANRAFQFHAGIFNLTITNVPGPPVPVYFLGRQLRSIVGSTPLTRRHALTIAAVSYNGQLTISVTTDPARLPTGSRLVDDLRAAFVELQEA